MTDLLLIIALSSLPVAAVLIIVGMEYRIRRINRAQQHALNNIPIRRDWRS